MKLTMLGTGNAAATKYYNTCFILEEQGKCFLVDGGGGNEVFNRIERAGYDVNQIHDLFITHKHFDHFLGALWVIKNIGGMIDRGKYTGVLTVYSHKEITDFIYELCDRLLHKSFLHFFDEGLIELKTVEDGDTYNIIGHDVTFFDICSKKTTQFGFSMEYKQGKRLVCLGDENYHEENRKYAENADWLMHEGFCLYSDKDELNPYKKGHSTVRDVSLTAKELGVKNLILYHTEDELTVGYRKELYTIEGHHAFGGRVEVPDDLESIEID